MAVKKLHLAKCMAELESQTVVKNCEKRATHLLVASAEKLFRSAREKHLDKDEELAYVHYMRFVELVLILQKRTDFAKHKNQLMQNASEAISVATDLKSSLIRRYSALESAAKEEENIISVTNLPEVSEVVPVPQEKSKSLQELPEDEEKLSISSSELHSLLLQDRPSVIIMDTRPENDFAESHIKQSCCISVPQEILKPGLTANKLETVLPKESLAKWFSRKEADYIVLVDWDSENDTQNIHLKSLKDAMMKWDTSCVLKRPPMVLKGGYKDWMLKYPMRTTQALKFDLMSNVKLSPVVTDLSGIEYPNLDESVNDEVQILNEKNSNGMLFKKSPMASNILNSVSPTSPYPDVRKPISAPVVNRRIKPNVDIPVKPSNNDVRPARGLSQSANSKKVVDSISETKIPPPVDRKSKASTVTDKNSNVSDNVLESFNKEQSLAIENVEIINEKLKKEAEFEKLCLRKELEAEESKNIEIQKQEELILQKMKQLTLESQEKEVELEKLKRENLKYKKLLDDKIYQDYRREKEKELDAKNKEMEVLLESVEKLRIQRKRKEAENQKKREVHPTVHRETASANSALRRVDNTSGDSSAFSVSPANTSEYTMPLSRQTSDGSGRGLVRSHSSPNIAQMMNEEEYAQHKTPSVDRSLKPKVTTNSHVGEINRARLRNLNPLYGNCPVRPATGLRNLGNTCFMNSVIQCLSNTIPLADYINSGQYVEHISRDTKQGTGGELVEEFAVVIKALWMGQYKSFYPKDFKNTVSKCLAVCIGNEQQDSHEFLVVLMEKLHADLNRRYMKNVPKLSESSCNEITFWQHHKNYNSSKISDIFDGLLKSTLTCLSCRKTSDSFEVFSCLSLPILSSRCTLKECFQHFLRAEKISGEAAWDCPRCKQKKEAEKKLHICRPPEVLVIQLKRFSYEGLWRRKLQTHVDFDLTLEVPYETNSHDYRMYSLYGIVNHYGTLEGGHYTAYCKTSNGKWFKYDDHEVSEISSSDIKTSAAYLLFYISSDFQSRL